MAGVLFRPTTYGEVAFSAPFYMWRYLPVIAATNFRCGDDERALGIRGAHLQIIGFVR